MNKTAVKESKGQGAAPSPVKGGAPPHPKMTSRGELRREVRGLGFEEGSERLSPREQNATGQAPVHDRAEALRNKALTWAQDAMSAIDTIRDRSRGAVDRLVRFVDEKGSGEIKGVGAVVGSFFGLFGTKGKVAGFVINLLAKAVGNKISHAEADLVKFTKAIDTEQTQGRKDAQTFRDGILRKADEAGSLKDIQDAETELASRFVPPIPEENEIFRDLLIQVAISNDMDLSGSEWNERNMAVFGKGPYDHSWDFSIPFKLDGRDVAGKLNQLVEADPGLKKPVRSHAR